MEATDLAEKLNLTNVDILSDELKGKIKIKFEEWGFLSQDVKNDKQPILSNLKKIHIVRFNVEKVLKSVYPIYSKFFSKAGFALWILALTAVIGCLIYSILNFDPYSVNAQEDMFSFTPIDIVFVIIGIFISTIFHEFAHAVTCIKYGGKVTEMGILLFYCIPCFYCDVTGVYSIKDKRKRAIVGGAGILTNLFMGNVILIIAIILSTFNINLMVLYYLSLGLIFISIYNLIPFVKMDGYWILSALSEVNNLMDKSIILAYTTIFSRKNLSKVNMRPGKRRLLSLYGVISLFFAEVFWIYTFYNLKDTFKLNEEWEMYALIIVICVMLIDFVKTIQKYYYTIKNNYERTLLMM